MASENDNLPKTNAVHLEAFGAKDLGAQMQDMNAHRRLRRKIDYRLIPFFAGLYLLNYLDRSNIGNGKVLNQETGDSLLQKLHMTPHQYSIVITLFAIMYSAFDVPANWVLKRHIRPSYWLGFLCFAWGACTLGFAFLHSFAAAATLRVFIGIFEAGFYPVGASSVLAVWIWKASEAKRGYPTGNIICAACSFATAILTIILRLQYGRMNRNGVLDSTGSARVWAL
ncbi:hypothetical protein LTR06_011251 [Exophiala xenobiotica]|nr:hypothetical protein LTR06_011251 [Exophiala xenobiotica]